MTCKLSNYNLFPEGNMLQGFYDVDYETDDEVVVDHQLDQHK